MWSVFVRIVMYSQLDAVVLCTLCGGTISGVYRFAIIYGAA
jgi:hypothetical protein